MVTPYGYFGIVPLYYLRNGLDYERFTWAYSEPFVDIQFGAGLKLKTKYLNLIGGVMRDVNGYWGKSFIKSMKLDFGVEVALGKR